MCLNAKIGNATCAGPGCSNPLTGTARRKFCSDGCRIASYRITVKNAKLARRLFHYFERNRSRALGVLTYGGPLNTSVPALGQINLKRFLEAARG